MRPLAEWDEDYVLNEITNASDESANLEKKSSDKFVLTTRGKPDGETESELAKQVSAFSNAGQGFLVYGIDDAKKSVDGGVPILIGRQPIKDWIEAKIPALVFPPVTACEAQTFQIDGVHQKERALLVISIPLSDRRPH